MKNIDKLLESIKEKDFTVSQTKKGEKIKQTEHRELKSNIMSALLEDLKEKGLAIGMSKDGIVIEMPNDNLGAIPVELDIKVKGLDYDTLQAVENYRFEKEEKEKRKKQANKDKKYSYNQAVKARKQKSEKK